MPGARALENTIRAGRFFFVVVVGYVMVVALPLLHLADGSVHVYWRPLRDISAYQRTNKRTNERNHERTQSCSPAMLSGSFDVWQTRKARNSWINCSSQ